MCEHRDESLLLVTFKNQIILHMKSNDIYTLVIAVVIFAALVSACKQEAEKADAPPNIVFIMSDDHAYQAISAYGHGLNETPQIDRIAEEGAIFTRATVTNSICAPSRAVILTGKHLSLIHI